MKHIAILKKPFFDMILNGKKTIESRWSVNKISPYNKVKVGDIILLKETGKDITVSAIAKNIECYELTTEKVEEIKQKYGKEIGMNNKEWQLILNKKYCTLIWLDKIKKIKPLHIKRSYGNGWIVIKD